jgi:hypothetical protein
MIAEVMLTDKSMMAAIYDTSQCVTSTAAVLRTKSQESYERAGIWRVGLKKLEIRTETVVCMGDNPGCSGKPPDGGLTAKGSSPGVLEALLLIEEV